jgi:hypothetical protein
VCPTCAAQLQPSERQLWVSVAIALCISIALADVLRLTGIWFVVATVLLWFPVSIAWDFIFVRIVPPRFEAYIPKHYKGGLF